MSYRAVYVERHHCSFCAFYKGKKAQITAITIGRQHIGNFDACVSPDKIDPDAENQNIANERKIMQDSLTKLLCAVVQIDPFADQGTKGDT